MTSSDPTAPDERPPPQEGRLWSEVLQDERVLPERLYHYATLPGLDGIVRSHSLWATDTAHFHDPAEINLWSDLLVDMLVERFPSNTLPSHVLDYVSGMLELSTIWYTCAVCFTENGDQLSQWRAYAGDNGVSIAFDSRNLARRAREQHSSWARVIYDPTRQAELARSIVLDEATDGDILLAIDNDRGALDRISTALHHAKLRVGPILKHHKFSEEREIRFWRVLSNEEFRTVGRFRVAGARLKPYVDFDFGTAEGFSAERDKPREETETTGSPISEALVSPGGVQSFKDINTLALFCEMHGLPTTTTENDLDYRWDRSER